MGGRNLFVDMGAPSPRNVGGSGAASLAPRVDVGGEGGGGVGGGGWAGVLPSAVHHRKVVDSVGSWKEDTGGVWVWPDVWA